MEKHINIYIVCSTKSDVLKEQKEAIIELKNELNEEYARVGKKIIIHTVGYDAPENEDVVSNKFIHGNAQIVVFLFGKSFSPREINRMESKLECALNNYKNFRRPEILVYFPKDAEEELNKNAEKLKKILETEPINIKLFEDDDSKDNENKKGKHAKLKKFVRDNIHTYINSYKIMQDINKGAKRRYYGLRIGLPIAIIAIIFTYFISKHIWSQPRLLIAGGGSAKNMLDSLANKNVTDGAFKIYAPLPSGSAYWLLNEETIMNVKDNDYHNRGYYTILLSAGKAYELDFLRYGDTNMETRRPANLEFRKTGVVMGLHMGFDSLMVFSKGVVLNDSITCNSLRDMIGKINKAYLYTTSKESGTLKQYKKYVDSTIKFNQEKLFSQNKIMSDTFIALGSKYYKPQNDSMFSTVVSDANPKPTYIYFMRYRNAKTNTYDLPKQTKDWLGDIGIPETLIDSIKKHTVDHTTKILFDVFCVDPTCKDTTHIKIKKIKHAK